MMADLSACASPSCPLAGLCARHVGPEDAVEQHRSVTVYLWTVADGEPDCAAFVPRVVREGER